MEIQLTPKQAEYIREAHHRWNFKIGATRSGKSHLDVQYVVPHGLISRHGKKGLNLIAGATKENIERNVLTPMRDIWGTKVIGEINTRNWCDIFGEKVYCIGAENVRQVSKLRGAEIKFCYIDEICDVHPEVFELLKSRLSLAYSECHGSANPASPTHFVKQFIDTPGIDLYCQHYTIYDNPFLPRDFVRGLEAEYAGTVYYQRYILGLWAKAEGLIYPMYQDSIEDTWAPDPDDAAEVTAPYAVSVDYGTQNAFVALKWRQSPDGVWHVVDEYFYSGRDEGHQKTDDDYVEDLRAFCWDAPFNTGDIEVIVDPSAASFITALHRKYGFKTRHADNNVADGIRDTAVCLQAERGFVKIGRNCENTLREFAGYVWADCEGDDRPVKVDDHCMDALRYFVRTKRLYRPQRDYESVVENMGKADRALRRFEV